MSVSLTIAPLDTLFFRGAEPMEAGENHFMSFMFPPMPSTLLGAIRTAMLVRNEIPFREFVSRHSADESSKVGSLLGTPDHAGFNFGGPLFLVEQGGREIPLLPAPIHWFTPKCGLQPDNIGNLLNVLRAEPIPQSAQDFGLCSSITSKPCNQWRWTTPPSDDDLKSLEGNWITLDGLKNPNELKVAGSLKELAGDSPWLVPQELLFFNENRVGIGRNNQARTALAGRLYSTTHVRMAESVRLLLLPDQDLIPALGTNGILQLGGEQRVAQYELQEKPNLDGKAKSDSWLSLSPIKSSRVKSLNPIGLASGKLRRIGGWEMKKGGGGSGNNKGFHREMEGWHPAGTVVFFPEEREVPKGWWGL